MAAIVCGDDVTVGDLAWHRALVRAQELTGQQGLLPRARELGRGSGKRGCDWESAGQTEGRRKGLVSRSSQQ